MSLIIAFFTASIMVLLHYGLNVVWIPSLWVSSVRNELTNEVSVACRYLRTCSKIAKACRIYPSMATPFLWMIFNRWDGDDDDNDIDNTYVLNTLYPFFTTFQMEGFEDFEGRRKRKFDKLIDSNVMINSKGLDEGVDLWDACYLLLQILLGFYTLAITFFLPLFFLPLFMSS